MSDVKYPRLIRRVQAVLIDGLITPTTAIGLLYLSSVLGLEDGKIKAGIVVLAIFVLESVLVSATGGTIGHRLMKLRIRRSEDDRNLNIFRATLRYIVKFLLGVPSLIFIVLSKKHQAFHDIVADSIVVHKSALNVPQHELVKERPDLLERATQTEKLVNVSKSRRVVVIIAYWLVLIIATALPMIMLISDRCLLHDDCIQSEKNVIGIRTLLLWGGLISIAYFGWVGKLYGCRNSKLDDDVVVNISNSQKILVITTYLFVVILVLFFAFDLIFSDECAIDGVCSNTDAKAFVSVVLFFIGSSIFIAYFGWNEKLYGCRKSKLDKDVV